MLESLRDKVLFTYLKSLEMGKKSITLEKQELASQVWDDIFDFTLINRGDFSPLLEAGLEVIIDNAVLEYVEKG
jgi:hypothetical protein